jgi:hypothetical protein
MELERCCTRCADGVLLVGSIGAALAQGASDYAPPHSRKNVPPGQGGKAPGQILNDKRNQTTGSGGGASQYAPPHSRNNEPPGFGGKPPGQIMNDKK